MWFLPQGLLRACSQSNCQPSKQLANTTTGFKGPRGDTRYFPYCDCYWFEPVLYLDPVARFPKTTEKPELFVKFADNVGDVMTFKILKNDLSTVFHRSVVRSAADPTRRNKRVTFGFDVQETLAKQITIPDAAILSDNQPKQRSRKPNDDVSNITRSKTGSIDQNVADRTRSKIQSIHNLDFQVNFFPLYDAIKFEDKRKVQDVNLQLDSAECRAYQSFILESKLQCQ
jgi:hypothetical protein